MNSAGDLDITRRYSPRTGGERLLLIGDPAGEVRAAVAEAAPTAQIGHVPSIFDAIAELLSSRYTSVLAPIAPMQRRPDAAVRELRLAAGDARLLLYGEAEFEPLSRKMLDHGADDYLITPVAPGEVRQALSAPLRLAPRSLPATSPAAAAEESPHAPLDRIPLAEILLAALADHPHDPVAAAVREAAKQIGDAGSLHVVPASADPPEGAVTAAFGDRAIQYQPTADVHPDAAAAFAQRVAALLRQTVVLQDRHAQLQRLAITDELTGVYNGRYFRHFLARILERARSMRFPVSLLLFDIDDFKKYNDTYGHAVGDQILKQAAALMKRSCREHDCVARLGGDEFGVIFWEKEGPRKPLPGVAAGQLGVAGRPPQSPVQIFERFRKLLLLEEFSGLGASGKGVLTISAGLAVYPYDATTPEALYEAADQALVFGSKRLGKDTVFIVGTDDPTSPPT